MANGEDGQLQVEIYAFGDVFQWLLIDAGQQHLGHRVILAQGSDSTPWHAEAAARQTRHGLLTGDDQRTELPNVARAARKLRRARTRVEEIRIGRGMTREELARRSGLPLEQLAQIEDE